MKRTGLETQISKDRAEQSTLTILVDRPDLVQIVLNRNLLERTGKGGFPG